MNANVLGGLLLHETFERRAAQTPDAIAMECGDRRWSYAELDRHTTRLARLLRGSGAGPGRFVAIYLYRSELPVVAILACHKSGAAYVPVDPAYPEERIRHISAELGPTLCLTETRLASRAESRFDGARVVVLDSEQAKEQVAGCSDTPVGREESGVAPSDLAYVIYTSGSTGRPKGVMTEHSAVACYVRAFNEVCATSAVDRVYQGFSPSFDGSVEEIWMAMSNGSTLVVPTRDAPRFGDDLGRYLSTHRVTYFSTVPTMLSTLNTDVPTLRTIVLSGEVCTPELVNRWATDGRRVLNVYGPTEATVNTTVAECTPGAPVTIGRPLTGYGVHVVDEELRPVSPGRRGELLITGPTLARGYVCQPELTNARFLANRHLDGADRCYRTGDIVRWTADGELEFHGRLDSQVKIRGYRVELSEIESVLGEHPQVRTAAVHLVERDGLALLAACVVFDGPQSAEPNQESLLAQLETRLPQYMVPAYLDVVTELPRTTSGKIDRRRLPEPVRPLIHTSKVKVEPRTALEGRIAEVWQDVLGVPSVSVEDDFFLDLGGHSLIAARMVTRLRDCVPHDVAVRDVYDCPSVRALANLLESRPRDEAGGDSAASPLGGRVRSARAVFDSVPRRRRVMTTGLQALSLYVLSAVPAIPLAILLLVLVRWYQSDVPAATLVEVWVAVAVLSWPVMLVVSIAAKWLLIGRYRPGDHPLWGSYYLRWWLCDRLQRLSGSGALAGTPLMPLYFRLMGARVGARCTLDTAQVSAWDLVTIGADTSIGADTQLPGYRVEDGMLRFGTVDVGSGCFVGLHSALGLGVRMGDGARLDDQSLLADGDVIPAGEGRRGSPARPAEVRLPAGLPPGSRCRRVGFGLAHLVAAEALGLLALLPLALYVTASGAAWRLGGVVGLTATLLVSVPLVVVMSCLFLAAIRRLVLPRMEPGTYPVESVTYLRKWLSDGLMRGARAMLLPVYTTLYLPPWLRLMGARIGPRAELSTVWNFAPELIEVGSESFFADGSIIGGRRTHRGEFQVSMNRVGRRSFVGNSAVLPVGTSLGDGCLLGVQSTPPVDTPHVPDGSEWLGSPPFPLRHRPKVGNFDDTVTYKPTRRLYLQRAAVDAARILIPGYLGLAVLVVLTLVEYRVWHDLGPAAALGVAPIAAFALALCAAGAVAGLKKLVMGTYRPEIKPLWSPYVWLNEMVNGAYESVVSPVLVALLGTPFAAPLLRLMGCRIGRHTYIATTLMSEFDLVEIGDYAALNQGAVIQNHLFEDRVFKSSSLTIGPEASIGNMTVVLYDTVVEQGVVIGPLSLLMKGETLTAGSRWQGIPTEHVNAVKPTVRPGSGTDAERRGLVGID